MASMLQVLAWPLHYRALAKMTTHLQFGAYVERAGASKFMAYKAASTNKRAEFWSVLRAINVNPSNLNFLDLGPGYGDSLDVCHERGARSVSFTEVDPFFFTHNRLKSFTSSYHLNHLFNLGQLPKRSFDLIWCKGSIVADLAILSEKYPIMAWRFTNWLKELESLAARSAHIVICPHWRNDGTTRRVQNASDSLLSRTMLRQGYTVLPEISGHNHQPAYPLTFHKVLDSQRGDLQQ